MFPEVRLDIICKKNEQGTFHTLSLVSSLKYAGAAQWITPYTPLVAADQSSVKVSIVTMSMFELEGGKIVSSFLTLCGRTTARTLYLPEDRRRNIMCEPKYPVPPVTLKGDEYSIGVRGAD
jgi:hypothetical protein